MLQILDKATVEGLLYTHDRIAGLKMDSGPQFVLEDDALLRRLGNYSEPNIKIVRIEKTSEPLGATVRNEDDAVVVGRIMRGGTAEASGLLHEGDEVLEVSVRAYSIYFQIWPETPKATFRKINIVVQLILATFLRYHSSYS